jgi:heptosyltransferase-2
MHIVVILPRWVGDAVMATPLLRTLKQHFQSRARITGVMRPVLADLLAGTGWIDDHIFYDRHGGREEFGFRAAVGHLRRDRSDITLVLPNSLSSAGLAFLGRGRRRVGHAGHCRRLLLTDVVRADPQAAIVPPPVAFMRLAEAIGVAPGSLAVELVVNADELTRGDAVLSRLFPDRAGPLVVLNDNSSNGTARAWGVDRQAALGRWIVDRVPDVRVLVHCGPADRRQAREIVHLAETPAVRSLADMDELPLGLSKAVYARAAVAVSSDSGPRHIAAGLRVPTVALLGPTDPRLGRSDPEGCVELRRDLACSPCDQRECPLVHHDCMQLLTVEEVGAAALERLRWGAERATARAG